MSYFDRDKPPKSVNEMRNMILKIMQEALEDIQSGHHLLAEGRMKHLREWVRTMQALMPAVAEETKAELEKWIAEGVRRG